MPICNNKFNAFHHVHTHSPLRTPFHQFSITFPITIIDTSPTNIYKRKMETAFLLASAYKKEIKNLQISRQITEKAHHEKIEQLEEIIEKLERQVEETQQKESASHYVSCLGEDWAENDGLFQSSIDLNIQASLYTQETQSDCDSDEQEIDLPPFDETAQSRINQCIISNSTPTSLLLTLDDLEIKYENITDSIILDIVIRTLKLQSTDTIKRYRSVIERYTDDPIEIFNHLSNDEAIIEKFITAEIVNLEDIKIWTSDSIDEEEEEVKICIDERESGYFTQEEIDEQDYYPCVFHRKEVSFEI